MPRLRCLLIPLGFLSGCAASQPPTVSAEAAVYSSAPQLRILSKMHTSKINAIDVGDSGRLVVTSSQDKTARVWSAADGRLVSIFRAPSGSGWAGELLAAAMAPHQPIIAVAGWTPNEDENSDWSVYIVDAQTGRILTRLDTGEGVPILDLRWSPDGAYLAAALSTGPTGIGHGVRVWSTGTWDLVGKVDPFEGACYHLSFDRSNRLAATSEHGWVELFDRSFRMVARVQPFGMIDFLGLAFSPDGTKVAVGHDSSLKVTVLSGKDLTSLFTTRPSSAYAIGPAYTTLDWSYDGQRLYAAGDKFGNDSHTVISVWGSGGKGTLHKIIAPGPRTGINAIRATVADAVAFATTYPSWGIVGARRASDSVYVGDIRHFSTDPTRFLLSWDGSSVAFGDVSLPSLLQVFSLKDREVHEFSGAPVGFNASRGDPALVGITDLSGGKPKLHGAPLPVLNNGAQGLAIGANDHRLIVATTSTIYAYNPDGTWLWRHSVTSDAVAIGISSDDKTVAVAFADGTIHWLRASDGVEFLAFFLHPDGQRWIAWTPSGYYDASVGGDELIAWNVNMGAAEAAHTFPASRFRKDFLRPDVISMMFQTQDENQALLLANQNDPARPKTVTDVAAVLPPATTILSPMDGQAEAGNSVTLHYSVQSRSGLAVQRLLVRYDGRPDAADAGKGLTLPTAGDTRVVEGDITVAPPVGTQSISLIAETAQNVGQAAVLRLKQNGIEPHRKPNLYIFAAGINNYDDPRLKLNFSAQDADAFSSVLQRHAGIYDHVVSHVLTDSKATRAAIIDGLVWLKQSSEPGDVAMLFLSGHGAAGENGAYYYLAADSRPAALSATAVSNEEIIQNIAAVKARVVVFLDTCHAGAVLPTGASSLANDLKSDENGAIVFASSSGNQVSREDSKWGNGAFTKALVDGIDGQADFTHRGLVTVDGLRFYVSDTVKAMTGQEQTPAVAANPSAETDFAIAD